MNKSDLKDYMVVEYRIGELRIVINNNLYAIDDGKLKEVNNLNNYDDELKSKGLHEDIVKVYDTLLVLTNNQNIKPLWKREEVDWSKVPFGTKVRCWNTIDDKFEGKFLGYDKGVDAYLVFVSTDMLTDWEYCELVEDPKEEVTYKEVKQGIEETCFKEYTKSNSCTGCKYKQGKTCNKEVLVSDLFTITRR